MGIFLRLNGCCCGCTLKTGSLIIGWLQLISLLIMMMGMAALLVIVDPNSNAVGDDEITIRAVKLQRIFITSMLVASVIFIIPSVILLIGIYKDRPKLVRGWVYFCLVMVIIEILLEAVAIIYLIASGVFMMALFELFRAVIYTLISWYFMSVVHSYYTETVNGTMNNPSVVKFT